MKRMKPNPTEKHGRRSCNVVNKEAKVKRGQKVEQDFSAGHREHFPMHLSSFSKGEIDCAEISKQQSSPPKEEKKTIMMVAQNAYFY